MANIHFKELIVNFGGVLFDKKIEFTLDDVFKASEISNHESKEKIIDLLLFKGININKKYIYEGEVTYFDGNYYFLCDLDNIVLRFKDYYFKGISNRENTITLIKKIAGKKMTKKEFDRHVEAKQIAMEMDRR